MPSLQLVATAGGNINTIMYARIVTGVASLTLGIFKRTIFFVLYLGNWAPNPKDTDFRELPQDGSEENSINS